MRLATEIKLRAERKAGEILKAAPKNEGARGIGSNQHEVRSQNLTTPKPPTLANLGVTKQESSRFQKLASIPAEDFDAVAKQQVPLSEAFRKIEIVTAGNYSVPTRQDTHRNVFETIEYLGKETLNAIYHRQRLPTALVWPKVEEKAPAQVWSTME